MHKQLKIIKLSNSDNNNNKMKKKSDKKFIQIEVNCVIKK